jgi:hypothetical protein
MRYLVLSPNYSERWNNVHEIFKKDLFEGKDAVFFGPGYPLWEDKTHSAVDLMKQFDADILFIFHSKWSRGWLTDIQLVKDSVNYQVDYYPEREREEWRDDYLIYNNFNVVAFPNRFMVDQFLARNKGRKLPITLYLPFGVNSDIFKPDFSLEKNIDVSGIMSFNKEEYPYREVIFDRLKKAFVPHAFFHRINETHEAFPLEIYINALQRSKISLHSCDRYRSTAMRCFEILACGAVLFSDVSTDFDILGFKEGVHYFGYEIGSIKAIPKLIDKLLARKDLQQIAENGVKFIQEFHTTRHRAEKLWTFLKGTL